MASFRLARIVFRSNIPTCSGRGARRDFSYFPENYFANDYIVLPFDKVVEVILDPSGVVAPTSSVARATEQDIDDDRHRQQAVLVDGCQPRHIPGRSTSTKDPSYPDLLPSRASS